MVKSTNKIFTLFLTLYLNCDKIYLIFEKISF